MYFVQKGNEKFSPEGEHDFLVTDKSGKNILTLIDKTIDLLLSAKSETLTLRIKEELMETNAIIKKNHYKANNKSISNILNKKFGVNREEEEQFN
jgi:CHASE3 domain sensor protein